jgi:chorismate mutase/prephenate dehydratase
VENQQNQALLAFRSEIDEIDLQLISLLKKRMEVVAKVAELKTKNNERFFIKSAREADMIKALISKADGILPSSVVVDIWRKIITSANMHEQPLSIAIHNPKEIHSYEFLVKEFYSSVVPIQSFDSINNVVRALEKNEAQIAIFALPNAFEEFDTKEHQENWWISLANNRLGLRVFATIPFVKFLDEEKNRQSIQLVAVATKEPEKSSSDASLLYVETAKGISKSQILTALKENSLDGKILKSTQIPQVEGISFHLVELDGFWLESDEQLKNFAKSKIKPYAKILGHFALPIVL